MEEIVNYENYSITRDGKVVSTKRVAGRDGKGMCYTKIVMSLCSDTNGYQIVGLTNSKRKRLTKLVHRLVAQAYIPNPENKPQVNHKDGDKTNNNVSNLEWCTSLENNSHALRTGLRSGQKGETNSQAKLTEKETKEIIELCLCGYSNTEIAEKYNLHSGYISLIRGKRRWKHLWEIKEYAANFVPKSGEFS